MKVILFSFLLFGVAWANLNCKCGERNAGRIAGGKETKKNEYPWMVGIRLTFIPFIFCGGTIVTPWHVITAAHCVTKDEADDLLLVAGAHDVSDEMDSALQKILVAKIIINPAYTEGTTSADIALLVTSNKIVFNKVVGPACMPSGTIGDELKGQMVKVIGWGRYDNDENNQNKTNKLLEVDLEVQSVSYCDLGRGKKICAHSHGKDPCKGDSGSPVVWLDPETNRFTLVGVVSSGPMECGHSGWPSLHVNVGFYRSWINMLIRDTKQGSVQACSKV